MPIDVKDLIAEVEKGLETDAKQRMWEASKALDFYHYRGEQHMQEFLRSAESPIDYGRRPYRPSGLLHELVNVLTAHLYSPGPSRTWSKPTGQEFLEKVYGDNHIDVLMKRCDQLSTVGDAAAIQVDAGDGVYDDKPITLRVWGPDEFHAWEDPDDRSKPAAVVTKDKYNQQTRFKLWTYDNVYTFMTQKGDKTNGGRVATLVSTEDNTYGCLPFGFTHYDYPVQAFWEPGVGSFLEGAEIRSSDRLSLLDESIKRHLNPLLWIENGEPGMRISIRPGYPVVFPGPRLIQGKTGPEQVPGATPQFLQAHPDVAAAWEDLRGYLMQILEAVGVPQSAVRMEQQAVASGISLIVEQAPLLTRAEGRRGPYGIYETEFARTILHCAGNHYGRADLVRDAKAGNLALGWPTPRVPVVTEDWLNTERAKIAMGVKSVIMFTQELYSVRREQAITILEQVEEDRIELERIMPTLSESGAPEPDEEPEGKTLTTPEPDDQPPKETDE